MSRGREVAPGSRLTTKIGARWRGKEPGTGIIHCDSIALGKKSSRKVCAASQRGRGYDRSTREGLLVKLSVHPCARFCRCGGVAPIDAHIAMLLAQEPKDPLRSLRLK